MCETDACLEEVSEPFANPMAHSQSITAFVPQQNSDDTFGFASQTGLEETVFAYRTSYQ